MNVRFQFEECGAERRRWRGVERLRRAIERLGRLLSVIRYPEPLALIPVRIAPSRDPCERRRRSHRD